MYSNPSFEYERALTLCHYYTIMGLHWCSFISFYSDKIYFYKQHINRKYKIRLPPLLILSVTASLHLPFTFFNVSIAKMYICSGIVVWYIAVFIFYKMRNGVLISLCMSVNEDVLISTALNGFSFLLQPKANQRAERMPFHPRRIFDYSEDALSWKVCHHLLSLILFQNFLFLCGA